MLRFLSRLVSTPAPTTNTTAEEQDLAKRARHDRITPIQRAAADEAMAKRSRGEPLTPTDLSDLSHDPGYQAERAAAREAERRRRQPRDAGLLNAFGLFWPGRLGRVFTSRLSARPDPNDLAARFRAGFDVAAEARRRFNSGGDDGTLPPSRFSAK